MTLARSAGLALLALTTIGSTCFAGIVNTYTDKSEFNTDAPSSMLLETFESHQLNGFTQILTSMGQMQKAVNSVNANEAFGLGDIQPNVNFWLTADNSETAIGWYVNGTGGNTLMMTADYGLRIEFDSPVAWFGMDIMDPFAVGTSGNITIKDSAGNIGSYTYGSAGFIGFHSPIRNISSVEFSNSWVDFDNVAFNSADVAETPEPGSFLLAGAGIASAWCARRRKVTN